MTQVKKYSVMFVCGLRMYKFLKKLSKTCTSLKLYDLVICKSSCYEIILKDNVIYLFPCEI